MSTINQGLEGIPVAKTKISNVDGVRGELVLSGYTMEEIIEKGSTYEDTLFLFLNGHLPSQQQSAEFAKELASRRFLAEDVSRVIDALPKNLDYIDALRTGVSVLGSEISTSYPPSDEQVFDIVAKVPTIVAKYFCARNGRHFDLSGTEKFGHAAYYLHLLTGNDP